MGTLTDKQYAGLSAEAKKLLDAAHADARQDAQRPARASQDVADYLRGVRANKYHAKAVTVNGKRFPSTKEGNRYSELCLMLKAGTIKWFCRQPRFDIEGGEYRPDFIIQYATGEVVIEDCKGVKTPIYLRSKKQMRERYGIEVRES